MSQKKKISITVELTESEAWNLAQFLKRSTFDTYLSQTVGGNDEDEAYRMKDGLMAVYKALRESGVDPR